ncbi:TIGR04211 family SH3 domain-containing protein [Desulfococcaceae bacterium HSG7]|nr:TIGR04211 family SH3 domain-containing protein [Desulfococcaceae bacterium HSG7]
MKQIILTGICLITLYTALIPVAYAETMYVGDIVKITVRTGPGTEHKIITMVKSGQQVEVLQPDIHWSEVLLKNGKQGWVLNRFLTTEKPCRLLLKSLEEKNKVLSEKDGPSHQKMLEEFKAENARLKAELAEIEQSLTACQKSYNVLRTESADFLALKSEHKGVLKQLTAAKEKNKQSELTLQEIQKRRDILWVLCGAGILILGFIIGCFSFRRERRSSFL